MTNYTLEYGVLAVSSILFIGFGIQGIRKKGRGLRTKELGLIDVIFSVGQLVCGLIGLLFLLYAFLFC